MTSEIIGFRVSSKKKKELKREAKRRGLTLSDFLRYVMQRFLETEIDLQGDIGEAIKREIEEAEEP